MSRPVCTEPRMSRTIVITGATGFIGGVLARRLSSSPHWRIRALVRSSSVINDQRILMQSGLPVTLKIPKVLNGWLPVLMLLCTVPVLCGVLCQWILTGPMSRVQLDWFRLPRNNIHRRVFSFYLLLLPGNLNCHIMRRVNSMVKRHSPDTRVICSGAFYAHRLYMDQGIVRCGRFFSGCFGGLLL